jgi:guanylate kinase
MMTGTSQPDVLGGWLVSGYKEKKKKRTKHRGTESTEKKEKRMKHRSAEKKGRRLVRGWDFV